MSRSRKHVSWRDEKSTLSGLVFEDTPNEIMFCVFRDEFEDLTKRIQRFHNEIKKNYDHIQIYLADY